MIARGHLKARTDAAHARVDALFSRLNLADLADYRTFLSAQAGPHLAVEASVDSAGAERILPDWPQRRRAAALRADLAELGIAPVADDEPFSFASDAEMLGAVYVLEGSRLGGSLLKRQVVDTAPRRFLDQDQAPGAWRKLLEKLDEALYDQPRREAAADMAEQVFARFEAAAMRILQVG